MGRADWLRIGVVFLFGLIHGIGFAGALGISEPFSWGLLGALLVFNVGIEVVQLSIIAIAFPILILLRRRLLARSASGSASSSRRGSPSIGLYWFVERTRQRGLTRRRLAHCAQWAIELAGRSGVSVLWIRSVHLRRRLRDVGLLRYPIGCNVIGAPCPPTPPSTARLALAVRIAAAALRRRALVAGSR